MDSVTAARIVNSLIFRPGWSFEAKPWSRYTIELDIKVRTNDSSYPPDYPYMTTTGIPSVVINTEDLDDDGLLYAVYDRIAYINEHEDREFLRRGDLRSTPAPFHPHHDPDGEIRFQLAKMAVKQARQLHQAPR